MYYFSTRDKEASVTASQAIKQGLAKDGGLFVPESFPIVTNEIIVNMSTMSYSQKASYIFSLFLTDYTEEEISEITSVYQKDRFETDNIAPIYKLNSRTYFLELWHGPTCAFKDMALQVLPHLLTKAVEKSDDKHEVVILTATSGDTGKAALEGFKDVAGTKIAVFFPEKGVSDIQRRQMVTQEGSNVGVCAVKGNFDDAQTGVKSIFTDVAYNEELAQKGYVLSSANSINWGRLVPQIVYYFSAYCDLLVNEEIENGEQINVVVPTGNFGNILAAYYAKHMGLPIAKLICASNQNNVLTDFIKSGEYNKNRNFFSTASPSMDILISSNLERLLYELSGADAYRTKQWMINLLENGVYQVPELTARKIKELFWGGYCSDLDTALTIKDTYEAYHYVIDPHTAVGKNVYDQYLMETGDQTKTIILSTASPFKFAKFVNQSIGLSTAGKDEFDILDDLSVASGMRIPKSLAALKKLKVRFNHVASKEDLKSYVNEIIKK